MSQQIEYVPLDSASFPYKSEYSNTRVLSIIIKMSGWLISYRRNIHELIRPKHFTHFSYALRQVHQLLRNYKVNTKVEFPYRLSVSHGTILPKRWVEILKDGKLTDQDTSCKDTFHKECLVFNRYLDSLNARIEIEQKSRLVGQNNVPIKTILVAVPTIEYLQIATPTILKINELNGHKI